MNICFHVLVIVNSAAMNIEVHVFFVLEFCLDICPGVALLDHMVILFFIFWETSILFSIVTVSTYIFTNRVEEFLFLHILSSIYYL